jgi:hypothetical protein
MPARDLFHQAVKNALIKGINTSAPIFDPPQEQIAQWTP